MKTFFFLFTLRQGCFIISIVYYITKVGFLHYEILKALCSHDSVEDVKLFFKLFWHTYFSFLVYILLVGVLNKNSWLIFTYSTLTYYKITMVTTYNIIHDMLSDKDKVMSLLKQIIELLIDIYFFLTSFYYYQELKMRWKINPVIEKSVFYKLQRVFVSGF